MDKKITFNITGINESDKIAANVNTMLDYYDSLSIKRTDLGVVFGDSSTEILLHTGEKAKLGDNGYYYMVGRTKDTKQLYNVAYVNYSGGNKMFAISNLAIALGDILSHEHFEKWYDNYTADEEKVKAGMVEHLVALRGAYAYALAIILINNTNQNKAMTLLQRVDVSKQFPFIDLPVILNSINFEIISQNMLDLAVADKMFKAGIMANWDLGTILDKDGNPIEIKEDADRIGKVPFYDNSLIYLGKVCEFIEYMIAGYINSHNLDFVSDDKLNEAVKAVEDFNNMLKFIRDKFKAFMDSPEGQAMIKEQAGE